MNKINRKYKFRAQGSDGFFYEAELPFTIEFDLQQNTNGNVTLATFKLYNISEQKRNALRLDQWMPEQRKVSFDAGYGESVINIFDGHILRAWSFREGVNVITQIVAESGVYSGGNPITSRSFKAGTTKQEIIEQLVGSLVTVGITRGVIGNFEGTIPRGNSYNGNTIEILKTLTDGCFFIYNNKAYCLKDFEAVNGPLQTIDASTGLLGTPIRELYSIHLEMLFEPMIIMGQRLLVNSLTGDTGVNQTWRVNSIAHKGIISEAVSGKAITSLGLAMPQEQLRIVSA